MTAKPISHLPNHFDATTLVGVLDAIGLVLPAGSDLLPVRGLSLSASGKRFTVAEVDEALAKTKLSIADRLAVKSAMSNSRLLHRQ